jgi:hypothetical protein
MDLGAYNNIDSIQHIAAKNGIEVPRLRGYRLMSNEDPLDITENTIKWVEQNCIINLCYSYPYWSEYTFSYMYDDVGDSRLHKYYDKDSKQIRWNLIHGKKRKVLKTYIHNELKRVKAQYDMFNKYIGRDDILYIHARIGGNNWAYYHKYVDTKPWFIEKVDDAGDSTYCDIYARLTYK